MLGKRSDDIIDFTHLQKRGILKKSQPVQESPDIVDLSAMVPASNDNIGASSSSLFGFMDNPVTSPSISSPNPTVSESDVNSMRIKIEDLEYKIGRFVERIEVLENKIEDIIRNVR